MDFHPFGCGVENVGDRKQEKKLDMGHQYFVLSKHGEKLG